MFDLFKKQEKPSEPQWPEFKQLSAQYLPEERTILAVTGANGFTGGRAGKEKLWTASIGLTAWLEEGEPELHRGEFVLSTIADDRLLEHLRHRTRPDSVIRFQGRVSEDGKRLLLLDLPEPAFDPELKAVLAEQKKTVTFEAEGMKFTLNRQVDWFETEVNWLNATISLVFDAGEDHEACAARAKQLLAAAADWDRRVREYAAKELTGLANDWAEELEDGGSQEISPKQFAERLELESIEVRASGGFQFWFGDGDLFYGHSVWVSGDLEGGPDDAAMEG